MTPLALCCRHASLPLEAVLAAGAVVNQRVCPSAPDMPFAVPGCTMTPLHIAAHGGLTSTCLTLVEHGGDLKATVVRRWKGGPGEGEGQVPLAAYNLLP
jgi:hypothetical protein